ncbi:tetratricopeptide tpr 1 repeat-containing protein [Salinisphaera shabanensis T35B1]
MLLALLRPEIRLAYHRSGKEFPVPISLQNFIGAGINLRKSGVIDFAQLIEEGAGRKQIQKYVLQFGDFINYWIVTDLLRTLEILATRLVDGARVDPLKAMSEEKLDEFSKRLAQHSMWFGYLDEVRNFESLKYRLENRILTYRKYINLNILELPADIETTKTAPGLILTETVKLLREFGIIHENTETFIRIDQYEQLDTLNGRDHDFGTDCAKLIHKMLAARDSTVSYRIGTRHYAWPTRPEILSTDDSLENKRDFSFIDIDEKLRRSENVRTWIFPEFAEDIFRRRLSESAYSFDPQCDDLIGAVFGKARDPLAIANSYVTSPKARQNVAVQPGAPTEQWRKFIEDLAVGDILSAVLAQAWVRQRAPEKRALVHEPPSKAPYPWDKEYWRKERIQQALMQIASRHKQQLYWAGRADLLALSGGNILVFLFLCEHVWEAWLRDIRGASLSAALPSIDFEIQSQGIREASEDWFAKQPEGRNARWRRHFINRLGRHFSSSLISDESMSYPGSNGFSVKTEELEADRQLSGFLRECVSYGDLYEFRHTSKTKGETRVKYYLAPIFSPRFSIPCRHTKEPEYVPVSELKHWVRADELPRMAISSQKDLFSV